MTKRAETLGRRLGLAKASVGRDLEELVGGAPKRGHDDDGPAPIEALWLHRGLTRRAHDGDQPLDRRFVGDGRAAKFHDNHKWTLSGLWPRRT